MPAYSRREFLIRAGLVAAGSLVGAGFSRASAQKTSGTPLPYHREYSGADFLGWEVALGDGVYATPGDLPVTVEDIETVHNELYSQLRANIRSRAIMAHNITFNRMIDSEALSFVHGAGYKFQVTDQPGQTVEGHLSVWDGTTTRAEYLVAFQWIVNPADPDYGSIRVWDNPGVWKATGDKLEVDQAWHSVQMVLDTVARRGRFFFDEKEYEANYVKMEHPDWGTEMAARFAAEMISQYPAEPCVPVQPFAVNFKDWYWNWNRANYLPMTVTY